MAVMLETSLGDITIDLFIDQVPILAANFLKLCKTKRYNNMLFHSVEKNFIARTGLTKTNTLNKDEGSIFTLLKKNNGKAYQTILDRTCTIPLYADVKINKETGFIEEYFHSKLKHNQKGIVSMANDLPNCIGSAFFITLRESIDYLDNKRSIIGVVAEGLDVLESINMSHVEDQIACQPLKPIRIFHTIILDDPFPDPPGLFLNTEFPSPLPIKDDIQDSTTDSKTAETEDVLEQELLAFERIARSEAKSRAIALEILGDLPDADLTPPDNVLFVCKLNPITEADDLKLIFSRFGEILSCDIIRDWKTGDSLQYGFIEFENAKSCEAALFKMEGCLIDDRRIHVDFCQSVSKQWAAFRRHGHLQKKKSDNHEIKSYEGLRTRRTNSANYVFSNKEKHSKLSTYSHDAQRTNLTYEPSSKKIRQKFTRDSPPMHHSSKKHIKYENHRRKR